jgi:hypothetical protein
MLERTEPVSIISIETKIQAAAKLGTDLGELRHDAIWMCRTLDRQFRSVRQAIDIGVLDPKAVAASAATI